MNASRKATFIWLAENIGTYSRAWVYPNQVHGWSMVSISKLSSWFLLLIISYALVALVTRPRNIDEAERLKIAGHS